MGVNISNPMKASDLPPFYGYSLKTQRWKQPDSHDGSMHELKYVYIIVDHEIAQVAKQIMQEMQESSFDEIYWDALEAKKTNETKDFGCIIFFVKTTSGFSRSEDILQGYREKYSKVKTIIVVCISKDENKDRHVSCPENSTYSKDPDIVFKYHINDDGSPHGCSSIVVKKLQSRVTGIAIRQAKSLYKEQHVETMRLNAEVKLKEQDVKKLEEELANARKECIRWEEDNKQIQIKYDEHVAQQLQNGYSSTSKDLSETSEDSEQERKTKKSYNMLMAENMNFKKELKLMREGHLEFVNEQRKLNEKYEKALDTVDRLTGLLEQTEKAKLLSTTVQQTPPKPEETPSTTLQDMQEETSSKRRKKRKAWTKRHGGESENPGHLRSDKEVPDNFIFPGDGKQGLQ